MKKIKGQFLVLFILTATLLLASCGQKNDTNDGDSENTAETSAEHVTKGKKNKDESIIKVGTNPVFPPCSYKNDDDELVGFERDAFDEIGKRIGRKVEWVELGSLDNLFGSLDSGAIDTIAFQVSINEDRQKNYQFSDVYGYNKIFLCVRKDFKYDDLDDLQGKKVLLDPSHSMYPILEAYNDKQEEGKKIELVVSEGGSMFDSIEQGKVDAGPITEVGFAAAMEEKDFNLKISGPALVLEENAYPFSKNADPQLIEDVNSAIKSMIEDGTMKAISEKHYKIDVTKKD